MRPKRTILVPRRADKSYVAARAPISVSRLPWDDADPQLAGPHAETAPRAAVIKVGGRDGAWLTKRAIGRWGGHGHR